jgi:hypothetical protein
MQRVPIAALGLALVACGAEPRAPDDEVTDPASVPDGGSVPDAAGDDGDADVASVPPTPEVVYRFLDTGDLASADKIVAGTWPVPRYADAALPVPLTWAEDPYGEKYWRFVFYGLRPLAHVLWAYRTTGEARYRDTLLSTLSGFLSRDRQSRTEIPYLWDKHTTAYRTMMLVNLRAKLDRSGDLSPAMRSALDAEIAAHGTFLADPRNFEGDYNHGLAEAAALLLVAVQFPALPQAPAWRTTALDRVASLLDAAVDEDGVEVEQSPYYHFYFLTGFWDLYRWARAAGLELLPDTDARVGAMLRYAAHIVQPDGSLPLMGASLARNVRRSTGLHYDEMAATYPPLDYVYSAGARGTPPTEVAVLFPSSGQAILHSGFRPAPDHTRETHVVFDVGPYRTSHSHLDALAVHVFAGGRPLLVDSGLFSYERSDDFDYFHGTAAHNTVVVDDRDQRVGSAIAGLTAAGPTWRYQSGRHGLYDGVTHRRAVVLLRPDLILVLDQLTSAQPHRYDQAWHLPPAATFEARGLTGVAVFGTTARLAIHQLAPDGVTLSHRTGSDDPIDGWYSEKYEIKVPATAVRYRQDGADVRYATLLAAGSYASKAFTGRLAASAARWTATVCGPPGARFEVRIDAPAGNGEQVTVSTSPRCP